MITCQSTYLLYLRKPMLILFYSMHMEQNGLNILACEDELTDCRYMTPPPPQPKFKIKIPWQNAQF